MLIKRLLAALAAIFGLVGVVGCVAAMPAVLSLGSRLSRANDRAFAMLDTSLATAKERVLDAQRRAAESRITTEDVRQAVQEWTRVESRQRIASHLQIESKAERAAATLRQAITCLETSAALLQGVQSAMDWGGSIGAPMDTARVEQMSAGVADLLGRSRQVAETADTIREYAAASLKEDPQEDRTALAVQLASRALAALVEIETRLGETADRLSDARARTGQIKSRAHNYIVAAEVVALSLLAWLAAGQAALCVYGWRNGRKSSSRG